jgi:hypothetical protein
MLDYFSSLTMLLPLMAAAYVYFAVTLSIIARKTATPDRWMAWIPILNVALMCRVGRKPVWWIILLLIPLVNLIVAVILWMAIAQARGKSAALGILALIPVLNFFLPLLLAMGPAAGVAPGGPALPAVCPACGSPECVGEDFCGFTGQSIKAGVAAAPTAAAAPAQPGFAAKAILAVILVLAVVYFGFGLISSAGKMLSGGGAPRGAVGSGANPGQGRGGLSGPVAGTLTEFPIDTAPQPARPNSVTTKDMVASAQQAPLPGGVRVSAMTSAQYQARPSDKPVTVNVMNAEPSSAPIARAMQHASGGDMTGINLRSARGGEYSGYRVLSPDTVTYVLDKSDAPIVVMIHAPDASVKEVADRLAANIGNGNGLYDDPSFQASLNAMPDAPAGLTLVESGTYSGAALEGTMEDFKSDLGSDFGAQAGGYLESVRKFIPPHLTTFRYEDTAHRRYQMAVGDYGGALKSWTTWQLLRFTAGLGGLQTVPFGEGSALSGTSGSTEYLVFRRAGSLGVISAPAGQGATAVRLAESIRQ